MSETRKWLRKNMRARWPLANLFIGIAFAYLMLQVERAGRSGGWWPDDFLRQFLFSLSVGVIILFVIWMAVLIVRRIKGRTS